MYTCFFAFCISNNWFWILWQAKRLTIEYTVLPLASQIVNENAPFVRSLLLHGAPKTGKTLLVHDTLLQKTEDIGNPLQEGSANISFWESKLLRT
jgi:hypothetical protein